MTLSFSDDETAVAGMTPSRRVDVALPRGEVVGRYVVLDVLGSGGMGIVYSAFDPDLDRRVALKLLRPVQDDDETSRGHSRLLQEAQAMARLSHPNVITVHDVGEHDGSVFVAMEFVEGVTLAAWLASPRPWRDVVAKFRRAGEGLAAAHDSGLIHRDFKPDNVMVGDDGRVRVMDFGLAQASRRRSMASRSIVALRDHQPPPSPDAPDRVAGTPAYMAPEQYTGRVDDAADQFSFCVALFEGLYGRRPFVGASLAELIGNIARGRITSVEDERGVPRRIRRVVVRGLAAERKQRYPSMRALLTELEWDPRGRRRWLAGAAGVSLLGLTALGWQRLHEARLTAECDRQASAIADIWNAETEAKVRDGLVATGEAYAIATFDKTRPWLAQFAERWSDTTRGACRSAAQDDWDEELQLRSRECLDVRSAELQALTTMLAEAERSALPLAARAAASLPPPDPCAEPSWLMRQPPLPKDVRRRASELQRRLATINALEMIGAYDRQHEEAVAFASDAEALGHPPLRASAWLALGRAELRRVAYPEAERRLEAAHVLAGSLAGGDEIAGEAAVALAEVARHRSKLDDSLRWAELASMWFNRADLPKGDLRRADVHSAIGNARHQRGEYGLAREEHERVLAIRRQALGGDHPSIGSALNNIANTYVAESDFVRASNYYSEAREAFTRAYGEQHPHVATVLGNLALASSNRGDLDAALEYARLGLQIRLETHAADDPQLAMSYSALGDTLSRAERYDEAIIHYERAFEIRSRTLGADDPSIAVSLDNLGVLLTRKERYDEALALHRRALEARTRTASADHPDNAISLLGIATVHMQRDETELGMEYLQRAVDLAERSLPAGHYKTASYRAHLANAAIATAAYETALTQATLALPTFRQERGESSGDVAWMLLRQGQALRGLRRPNEASPVLRHSIELGVDLGDASLAAHGRLALAELLWQRDPARARSLAQQAADACHADATACGSQLASIEAWLTTHPAK